MRIQRRNLQRSARYECAKTYAGSDRSGRNRGGLHAALAHYPDIPVHSTQCAGDAEAVLESDAAEHAGYPTGTAGIAAAAGRPKQAASQLEPHRCWSYTAADLRCPLRLKIHSAAGSAVKSAMRASTKAEADTTPN